ncbi:MAG TPA: CsbD family protein [Candidatus Angelobacter sp.]|nr:CsbD family protein [Candidatus Angelobacter sp.]
MDKERIKGKAEDVAGRVERQVGEWTGNEKAQAEGLAKQAEGLAKQAEGKARNAVGKMKDGVRDAADKLREEKIKNEEDRKLERDIDRDKDKNAA